MSVGNTYPRNVLSRRECLTILMRCFANNNTNELKLELRFLQVKHPIVSDRKIRRISTRSITLRPLTTGCLGLHGSVRLGLGPQQLVVLHVCLDCPPAFVQRRSVPGLWGAAVSGGKSSKFRWHKMRHERLKIDVSHPTYTAEL